jgi:hypothetical protein
MRVVLKVWHRAVVKIKIQILLFVNISFDKIINIGNMLNVKIAASKIKGAPQ